MTFPSRFIVLALGLSLTFAAFPADAQNAGCETVFRTTEKASLWERTKRLVQRSERPYALRADVALPPHDVAIVMLGSFGGGSFEGRTTRLDREADSVGRQLGRRVITYLDFPTFGYADPEVVFEKYEFHDPVRYALTRAVARSPGAKAIMVRLDGINPKKINQVYGAGRNLMATNAEIRMILASPEFYTHTRWLHDHVELSETETFAFFQPYAKDRVVYLNRIRTETIEQLRTGTLAQAQGERILDQIEKELNSLTPFLGV